MLYLQHNNNLLEEGTELGEQDLLAFSNIRVSIHHVITDRIDHLRPSQQLTLKVGNMPILSANFGLACIPTPAVTISSTMYSLHLSTTIGHQQYTFFTCLCLRRLRLCSSGSNCHAECIDQVESSLAELAAVASEYKSLQRAAKCHVMSLTFTFCSHACQYLQKCYTDCSQPHCIKSDSS